MHSLFLWDDYAKRGTSTGDLQVLLCQCGKFAVICFFLISGFLLGDRLQSTRPRDYLRRRWQAIGVPWLFWSLVYTGALVFVIDARSEMHLTSILLRLANTFVFSAYWFVPHSLLSLALLLAMRKYLDRMWFGGALAAVSLFFGVNAYLGWVPNEHTTAVGGYAFYLWLGHKARQQFRALSKFVEKLPWTLVLVAIAVSGALALAETYNLIHAGSDAGQSSIRLSNQLFSLCLAVAVLKGKPSWPKFVSVRSETFGIYLLHPFSLLFAKAALGQLHLRLFDARLGTDVRVWNYAPFALCYWAAGYVLTYCLALAATKALIACGFGALVGCKVESAVPAEAGGPVPNPTAALPKAA